MIFHEFDKLRTFLLVMKEKSLSSASKKLEVSQPAVTQQIQYLENLTGFKIIERKRQGVELTKKGDCFFEISKRLEKALSVASEDLEKLKGKNLSFLAGATFLVGDYIFSKIATEFRKNIEINFSLEIDNPNEILTLLKNKKLDIVLTEEMIADDQIQYFEWLDDELLIFSNQKIPKTLDGSLLNSYQWICRDKKSNTRKLFKESLELALMPDCDDFMMITDTTSSTSILQTVLHSRNNEEGFPPIASVISKFEIFDYVKDQKLFIARLPKVKMKRKIYIACLKENLDKEITQNAIQFLKSKSDDFDFKI